MNYLKAWKKLNKRDKVSIRIIKKHNYYLFIPSWSCYDDRPKRISEITFTVLSILPWYKVNPYNGYLVQVNKHTSEEDFSDFKYNPWEKKDATLREELGF